MKAHIIPQSFYSFDKKNHKPAQIVRLSGTDTRISTSRIGMYDTTMVTAEGEAYFSTGDDYACKCLIRRGQHAKRYHDGTNPLCIEIANFDYPKLKMFFLSLLWRAAVTIQPFFRHVQLGPHEERVKQMILARDPGDPQDYAVVLGIHRDTTSKGLPMLDPVPLRDDETKVRYYRFSLGHVVACIKVDQQPYGSVWQDFVLRPNGPLRFIVLDDFKETALYKSLGREVRRIHKSKTS